MNRVFEFFGSGLSALTSPNKNKSAASSQPTSSSSSAADNSTATNQDAAIQGHGDALSSSVLGAPANGGASQPSITTSSFTLLGGQERSLNNDHRSVVPEAVGLHNGLNTTSNTVQRTDMQATASSSGAESMVTSAASMVHPPQHNDMINETSIFSMGNSTNGNHMHQQVQHSSNIIPSSAPTSNCYAPQMSMPTANILSSGMVPHAVAPGLGVASDARALASSAADALVDVDEAKHPNSASSCLNNNGPTSMTASGMSGPGGGVGQSEMNKAILSSAPFSEGNSTNIQSFSTASSSPMLAPGGLVSTTTELQLDDTGRLVAVQRTIDQTTLVTPDLNKTSMQSRGLTATTANSGHSAQTATPKSDRAARLQTTVEEGGGEDEDTQQIIEQFNSAVARDNPGEGGTTRKKIPVACRHWLAGRCNVIHCRFLHESNAPQEGEAEIPTPAPQPPPPARPQQSKQHDTSRIVCRHWLQNRCNVLACRFMHSNEFRYEECYRDDSRRPREQVSRNRRDDRYIDYSPDRDDIYCADAADYYGASVPTTAEKPATAQKDLGHVNLGSMNMKSEMDKVNVCRHFLAGRCNVSQCRFPHILPEDLPAYVRALEENREYLTAFDQRSGGRTVSRSATGYSGASPTRTYGSNSRDAELAARSTRPDVSAYYPSYSTTTGAASAYQPASFPTASTLPHSGVPPRSGAAVPGYMDQSAVVPSASVYELPPSYGAQAAVDPLVQVTAATGYPQYSTAGLNQDYSAYLAGMPSSHDGLSAVDTYASGAAAAAAMSMAPHTAGNTATYPTGYAQAPPLQQGYPQQHATMQQSLVGAAPSYY